MIINPIAIESNSRGEKQFDCFSRLYNSKRIVFLVGEIEEELVTSVISQLLYLDSISDEPITMLINSPGGVITDGLSLVDIMKTISSPVKTICIGQACSMGAFVLSCGEKGSRAALPNARIMIHQPSGGAGGQETDIKIQYKEIMKLREILEKMLAENCGKPFEQVNKDCERDFFMSAAEAKEYGLIDYIKEYR